MIGYLKRKRKNEREMALRSNNFILNYFMALVWCMVEQALLHDNTSNSSDTN